MLKMNIGRHSELPGPTLAPKKMWAGLWCDETAALFWADSCRANLLLWIDSLVGNKDSDLTRRLAVAVTPPTQGDARRAFDANGETIGVVRLSLGDDSLEIKIPLPFHGVFLSPRQGFQNSLVSVWGSWLGEAPGLRILRPTSLTRRKQLEWRIGLPGGAYVGAPLCELKPAARDKLSKQRSRLIGDLSVYPTWLRDVLGVYGPCGLAKPDGKRSANAWLDVHAAILANRSLLPEATDEDDLEHRILVSFPVWLKHRISSELLRALLQPRNELSRQVLSVLRDGSPGSAQLAKDAWETLVGSQESISDRITAAIHSHNSATKTDFIDPINPLDLVSRITRVRRLHIPSSEMDEIPAEYRQNHPSFRGRLCPVESPESEMVGLSLQLAAGATVDFDGRIHPAARAHEEIGFGAGLIPFFAHNDGARNMMGAKNLRQAVPLMKPERAAVQTGGEARVQDLAAPLLEIRIGPGSVSPEGHFAQGRDLLVAYLPWEGWNFEDAMVLGQQVVDQGLLDVALRKRVSKRIKTGWSPAEPKDESVLRWWGKPGLAKEGELLLAGSVIASLAWEGKASGKRMEIRHDDRAPAVLRKIEFKHRTDLEWAGGVLEYELELPLPVKLGDKLMGRHGNKGVVGAILPVEQMPRLPDSQKLPPHLRGRPIDILLNPHGVISRMNLGQLIETHIGWLLHSKTCQVCDFTKAETPGGTSIGQAFADVLDHGKIQGLLAKSGLDRHGRISLQLPGGKTTASPVVVGFQHIVRLRHVPQLKSQARRGGKDALYNMKTTQAIHGRKLGGGQRLGEMEVWALAGHQAEHLLAEFLGVKSSAELVALSKSDFLTTAPDADVGFRGVLKDWLFALLINLELTDDQVRISFADADAALARIGASNRVVSGQGLDLLLTARFCCPSKGKKHPCEFAILDGIGIAVQPPEKGRPVHLSLGDLLNHFGLRAAGPLEKRDRFHTLPLRREQTGRPDGAVQFDFEATTDQLKAVARPLLNHVPSSWPKNLQEITLYGRFDRGKERGGGNFLGEELIQEFMKADGVRSATEMDVTCADHPTIKLKGRRPFGEARQGIRGGLFDPQVFGSSDSALAGENGHRWGYIELPEPISYPLHLFLTKSRSERDQAKAVESFCRKNGIATAAIPVIRFVPVLPIHFRMPFPRDGKLDADEVERRGYAPLANACRRYADAESQEKKALILGEVRRRVEDLFALLIDAMRDKTGLIRQHGLGRRVDRSARLVVTPNPALRWDQAGIPVTVLAELMGDIVAPLTAVTDAAGESPCKGISWLHPKDDPMALEQARGQIQSYLASHPDFVVLLNRQPSLHRDSFQAFHPVPLPASAGEVIQLCPLACAGFGADFDGDEMVVHIPLNDLAQKEAANLLPSRNPFSQATGKLLAHFDQDVVMGTYWLGEDDPVGLHQSFLELLPNGCCRSLVKGMKKIRKGDAEKLTAHLCEAHRNHVADVMWKWMNLAFRACTRIGVSYGYYELREIAEKTAPDSTKIEPPQLRERNAALERDASAALQQAVGETADLAKPGLHFAAMSVSGARGKLEQIRQIVVARGELPAGATGFPSKPEMFYFSQSLVQGLSPDAAFLAAMNARSSMCDKKLGTGHAGALTRELVFAMWPFTIVNQDCGEKTTPRSAVTCRATGGCCAACYGSLPDGKEPPVGFPAGLIAAQSIGERGTQLSMQSFHTGKRALSIKYVRDILAGREEEGIFSGVKRAGAFLQLIKIDAYAKVLDRHFEVLWRLIHNSPGKTLQSAIENRELLARLAFQNQAQVVGLAAAKGIVGSRQDPIAKVLFAEFGKSGKASSNKSTDHAT